MQSNLVWGMVALFLLGMAYHGVRRGTVRLSLASAMTLTILICAILLPVISLSDDLLTARQATLPLAGQTWRITSEDASVALDLLFAATAYLLLLTCFQMESRQPGNDPREFRPLAGRLVRSQRLRPPPFPA